MKKTLIVVLSALFLAIALLSGMRIGIYFGEEYANHLYPRAGIVTEVNRESDTVTFTDCAGLSWAFCGCEDWLEGDIVSCVMHDSGTPESVYDDAIVKAYYAGAIEDAASRIGGK